MFIKKITLTNFRNHTTYHLDCKPDTTLILGENGCGKTSVLEAIYILTRGKSFRATDPDILKRGKEYYRIELEYDNGEIIAATFDGTTKTFKTIDKTSRRLALKNKYPIILFLPSDLNLVSGPPSRRRDYFDRIYSDFSDDYAVKLRKYNKALRQRNELLKQEVVDKTALFPWDLLLANLGSELVKYRTEFTAEINKTLNKTYYSIAENKDIVELLYTTAIKNITKDIFLNQLNKNHDKDCILGYTTFGIQRDTFDFIFNNKPADGSASRGETRSIILALKFVEAAIVENKLNKKPIILLDDVFSELDDTRRHCLVNNFKNHQVIITSVEDINY